MNNAFFEISKTVANDFLQSIVFVDDRAFASAEVKGNHDFDAYSITKSFAEKQKVCAIYSPRTVQDIDHLAQLAKKADITVLDWQINLVDEPVPAGKEEEDANEVDPRGPHTLKIVNEILADPITGLGTIKLILVYTGEIALQAITNEIHNSVARLGLAGLKQDFCEVSTDNIKILVIAKPDNLAEGEPESRFKHNPEFNARIKRYEELPEFILEEFTKLTSGLLSNFVLKSLTIIKNNSFKLLSLYNKGLDIPFLSHRLLLDNQDDSKDQLIEIFADSIHALLYYNDSKENLSLDNIKNWVDTQRFSKQISTCGKDFIIDNSFIKKWAEENFIEAVCEQWNSRGYGQISDENKRTIAKKLTGLSEKESSLLLVEDGVNPKDVEYSILTHHKSIFKPASISPRLTLGAIVKGSKTGYWVCIQQRCDSVRVDDIRRFLFLPLHISDKKFHFITRDGIKLRLSKKSYHLRTIKFMGIMGEGTVKAVEVNGRLVFEPYYKNGHGDYSVDKDEVYEWVLDLKDLHAQRIAHEFATELSRVGLDESEWLRRRYS